MEDNTNAVYRGIGISGVLTIIFVIAKILGLINWSWVWVLSPIWISWIIGIAVLIIVGIISLIYIAIADKKDI